MACSIRSLLPLLVPVVVGCSKGDGSSQDCSPPPPPVPAFRLELTADGPLPGGTKLSVTYQGTQVESYFVGRPAAGNEDVCCRPGRPVGSAALPDVGCGAADGGADAGTDGAGIEALHCDLWTNGGAEVVITAPGYPELDRVLTAKLSADGCGVATSETRIVLLRADAGQ